MLHVPYWRDRETAIVREIGARKGWLGRGRGDRCPVFRVKMPHPSSPITHSQVPPMWVM